jgi:5'-nucleotidase
MAPWWALPCRRRCAKGIVVRLHRPLLAIALVAAAVVGVPPVAAAAPPGKDPVQVLAINDFHGRISPTTGDESRLPTAPGPDGVFGRSGGGERDDVVTQVGGAANMATLVQERRADFRRGAGGSAASFFVGVGDLIGESPPESATYKDEPTVEVLNALGLDVAAVGNHEFDLGLQELRRLSAATDGRFGDDIAACQGVTPGVDGCFGQAEHAFTGANFPYLAANILSPGTGEPILPPFEVLFTPRGVRVALIGVMRESTATSERPEGLANVVFREEADAVNRLVPQLRSEGIEAIGVLLHAGGQRPAGDINSCEALDGAVVDINQRITPAVDFIVSADTHEAYNCMLPVPGGEPRLVTQAGSYGQMVTDVRLTLDRGTGDVDRAATYAATNVPVTREAPDAGVRAIVDYWVAGPAGQVPAEGAGALPGEGGTGGGAADDNRLLVGVVILGAISLAVLAVAGNRRARRNRRRRAWESYGYAPVGRVRTPPRVPPADTSTTDD